MKVLPEKEEYIKTTIRSAIALNPLVSIRKMQELVEHNMGRSISDKYVAKLMRKIRREAIIQSDRKMMNERLAEVREKFRVLMDHLNRIVFWQPEFLKDYGIQPPKFNEKIAAIRLLAQLELKLFRAELDAGIFENRRTAIEEMLRQGVLPTELREQVVAVFKTWKLQPTHQQDTKIESLPIKCNTFIKT